MSSRTRDTLIDDMSVAMRRFMAQAVLYQDAVAKSAGVHATDLQCAGLLMLDGPLTPSELARRTGLSTGGAITAVIDRLEHAGLVTRTRNQRDRRHVLVTPNIDALTQRVGPIYARVAASWNDYLAALDDDQIALATDVIRHATTINRDETEALRATPPPPKQQRRAPS